MSIYEYNATKVNYASREFNLLSASFDKLHVVLHDADALLMKITGILGSDLIKGALDQSFVLKKMKELTAKREAMKLTIFSRQERRLLEVKEQIADLQAHVEKANEELNEWFE